MNPGGFRHEPCSLCTAQGRGARPGGTHPFHTSLALLLCPRRIQQERETEKEREREITKTKPRSLAKGMSVPIAKLRSFTSIRASVRIPRSLLSLLRQGRLSQRSQEVPVWHCYSVLGPEFPFGTLTGLLFTALTLKFGKWILLKRFKIYFRMAIKAMLGMNANMQ